MKPDLAPLPYELTAYEKSEAAVYQCQILRQARERSEIEASIQAKTKRPALELWSPIPADYYKKREAYYRGGEAMTREDRERWGLL